MESLCTKLVCAAAILQLFALLWGICRLILRLRKRQNPGSPSLRSHPFLFWLCLGLAIVMGILTVVADGNLPLALIGFFAMLAALFAMLYLSRWKIEYEGETVRIRKTFGKIKAYSRNELSEEFDGRFGRLLYGGKTVASYDILLVNMDEWISFIRYLSEKERERACQLRIRRKPSRKERKMKKYENDD